MAFRHIPTMTKSHHGRNMSVINMCGILSRHIPSIDNDYDKVDQLRFSKVLKQVQLAPIIQCIVSCEDYIQIMNSYNCTPESIIQFYNIFLAPL